MVKKILGLKISMKNIQPRKLSRGACVLESNNGTCESDPPKNSFKKEFV